MGNAEQLKNERRTSNVQRRTLNGEGGRRKVEQFKDEHRIVQRRTGRWQPLLLLASTRPKGSVESNWEG